MKIMVTTAKTRWVDGSYINTQGRKILWIVPEGGAKNQGVTAKEALRILDSDTDSLRVIALSLMKAEGDSDKTYYVALNLGSTYSTLDDMHSVSAITKMLAEGKAIMVYDEAKAAWVKPEAVGIAVAKKLAPPPPPAAAASKLPPPSPASQAPAVIQGELVTAGGPPESPGMSLKDRVLAAR